ncbi:MAG: DUF5683 domain-containing protein [Ginsengibacter sp.]
MQARRLFFKLFFLLFLLPATSLFAQKINDTLILKNNIPDTSGKNVMALDTALSKKFNPRVATFRSLVLPGWGQAYNKKYWKIPIIYGALGVTTGVFFYNIKTYNLLREAVRLKTENLPGNDLLIDPKFRNLSLESLRGYRNAVRQDIDYSVLFFLLFWGLNVVDATVDAHLKAFDISPDITLRLKPTFAYPTGGAGLSLVFSFK